MITSLRCRSSYGTGANHLQARAIASFAATSSGAFSGKVEAGFRRKCDQLKKLERVSDSIKSNRALNEISVLLEYCRRRIVVLI
jgi:hypothetical protein